MKQRISITLDKETLELLEAALKSQAYRSRSHVIEFLINKELNGKEIEAK